MKIPNSWFTNYVWTIFIYKPYIQKLLMTCSMIASLHSIFNFSRIFLESSNLADPKTLFYFFFFSSLISSHILTLSVPFVQPSMLGDIICPTELVERYYWNMELVLIMRLLSSSLYWISMRTWSSNYLHSYLSITK